MKPAPGTSVWPNASWEEGADEEWWAPVHEDGSHRPWPEAPAAEVATPDLEWRRGTIPEAVWKTGWWRYGTTNEAPSQGVRLYGPEEYTDPSPLEWWAPVNSDGSPRPWPEASSSPAEPQPAPQPGTGDMAQQLIDFLQERRQLGIERYGTPLQAGNGRKALVDLRDELLDAVLYCQQEIEERRALQEQVKRFGDVAVQVIALLEKRKRLGIDDVVTVVKMLSGVVPGAIDTRLAELEKQLAGSRESVMDCSGLLERNKNLELLLADAREDLANAESEAAELTDTCAALREELSKAKQEADDANFVLQVSSEVAECRECHTRPPYRCKPDCSTQALDGVGHEECRNTVRNMERQMKRQQRDAERDIEVEKDRFRDARLEWDAENADAWRSYDEMSSVALELVDAFDAGRVPRMFALNAARALRR